MSCTSVKQKILVKTLIFFLLGNHYMKYLLHWGKAAIMNWTSAEQARGSSLWPIAQPQRVFLKVFKGIVHPKRKHFLTILM